MKHYDNFINGEFRPSEGTQRVEVRNPSTGALICTVPDSDKQEMD